MLRQRWRLGNNGCGGANQMACDDPVITPDIAPTMLAVVLIVARHQWRGGWT